MKKTSPTITLNRKPSDSPLKTGIIAKLAKAASASLGNAPAIDPGRDPQWARNYEIFQEEHMKIALGRGAAFSAKTKLRGMASSKAAYSAMLSRIGSMPGTKAVRSKKICPDGKTGNGESESCRQSVGGTLQHPVSPSPEAFDLPPDVKLSRRDRESIDHFKKWSGMMGAGRGKYYGKHSDAIWAGRRILKTHGVLK